MQQFVPLHYPKLWYRHVRGGPGSTAELEQVEKGDCWQKILIDIGLRTHCAVPESICSRGKLDRHKQSPSFRHQRAALKHFFQYVLSGDSRKKIIEQHKLVMPDGQVARLDEQRLAQWCPSS